MFEPRARRRLVLRRSAATRCALPAQRETAPVTGGRKARAVGPGGDESRLTQAAFRRQRVTVNVDGFNLYNGIKAAHGHKYLWLDVEALAARLLLPGQVLTGVLYCTARVRDDVSRHHRQAAYIWALAEHCSKLTILEGQFKVRNRRCRSYGATWKGYEEKETDVNLATHLVEDAAVGQFDVALPISADSDLCPAVRAVKRLRPEARTVACFPPNRWSEDLQRAVDAWLVIGEGKLRQSQLPATITTRTGVVLKRPKRWT